MACTNLTSPNQCNGYLRTRIGVGMIILLLIKLLDQCQYMNTQTYELMSKCVYVEVIVYMLMMCIYTVYVT